MQWKSSTPKRTPEPWRAVPPAGRQTQWTIYEGEGFHAKWVCKMYLGEAPDLEEPYARLIAAAPELLEACRVALAGYRGLTGDDDGPEYFERTLGDVMNALSAAIAKAEGRS